MATTTPRLALPRPAPTDPADGPDGFIKLTDKLDTTAAVYAAGAASARPAAGTAGRLYWNSDTKQLDYDDGTNWNPASPGEPPIGAIQMWPNATAPANNKWLLCNGTTVSATTYAALAAILGQSGGLVTLPNFVGRIPIGPGALPGSSRTAALKDAGGAADRTLTTANMPSHSHGGSTGALTPDFYSGQKNQMWPNSANPINAQPNLTAAAAFSLTDGRHTHTIAAEGGGAAFDNMPPYFAVYFIIRAL